MAAGLVSRLTDSGNRLFDHRIVDDNLQPQPLEQTHLLFDTSKGELFGSGCRTENVQDRKPMNLSVIQGVLHGGKLLRSKHRNHHFHWTRLSTLIIQENLEATI